MSVVNTKKNEVKQEEGKRPQPKVKQAATLKQ